MFFAQKHFFELTSNEVIDHRRFFYYYFVIAWKGVG